MLYDKETTRKTVYYWRDYWSCRFLSISDTIMAQNRQYYLNVWRARTGSHNIIAVFRNNYQTRGGDMNGLTIYVVIPK